MAMKIVYKNHCTPQEKPSSANRYYLDSDCGLKLTGNVDTPIVPTSVLYGTVTATTSGVSVHSSTSACKFLFLRNNGTSGIDVTIATDNGTDYFILIGDGEAFASEMDSGQLTNISHIKVKSASSTVEVEYYIGY